MSYWTAEQGKLLRDRAYRVIVSTESSIGEGFAAAVEIANSELQGPRNPSGGLHFEFDIAKDLTPEPNRCSVSIYNLSENVRNALDALNVYDPKRPRGQKKPGPRNRDAEALNKGKRSAGSYRAPKTGRIRVEITAGYRDTGTSLIFRGDMRRAISKFEQDGSWCTRIEGEDGGRTTVASRINESFGPGTSHLTVVRALADALGLGYGNLAEVAGLLNGSYPRGTVCTGPAAQELAGVLRRAKIGYTIKDGQLNFLPFGPPKTLPAVLLSPESGLIGSPQRQSDGLVQVTSLLNPQLALGSYVALDSKVLHGEYFVQRVKYRGSNYGDDWYAVLELRAV